MWTKKKLEKLKVLGKISAGSKINTKEKLSEATNISIVPKSKGTYPGLTIINTPTNPRNRAVILCILIISPKIIGQIRLNHSKHNCLSLYFP